MAQAIGNAAENIELDAAAALQAGELLRGRVRGREIAHVGTPDLVIWKNASVASVPARAPPSDRLPIAGRAAAGKLSRRR